MHLGTNDVWNNIPAATILAAYGTLVDQMRASNPSMKILVAQIIPMTPGGCTWCPPGVAALNNAIPAWAAGKTTAQSPITVVDQFTGFDTVADTTRRGAPGRLGLPEDVRPVVPGADAAARRHHATRRHHAADGPDGSDAPRRTAA